MMCCPRLELVLPPRALPLITNLSCTALNLTVVIVTETGTTDVLDRALLLVVIIEMTAEAAQAVTTAVTVPTRPLLDPGTRPEVGAIDLPFVEAVTITLRPSKLKLALLA